jgi:Flp pilus assembly pilin Flp
MKTLLHNLKRRILELTGDRRGQTMIEYALLVGFLALAGALLLSGTGQNVGTVYTNVAQVLDADGGAPVAGSPPSSPSNDGGDSGNDSGNGGDSGNDSGNGGDSGNDSDGNGGGNGNGNGNGEGNGNNNGNAGGNGKENGNGGKK